MLDKALFTITMSCKCTHTKRCSEHSLAALFPNVMHYWNFDRNIYLNPYRLPPKTRKFAWFTCQSDKNCGHHIWKCRIESFVNGTGCPFCVGRETCPCTSLWKNCSSIQESWDFTKNTICPDTLTLKSAKKCWFRCPSGHSWEKRIDTFIRNPKCPSC